MVYLLLKAAEEYETVRFAVTVTSQKQPPQNGHQNGDESTLHEGAFSGRINAQMIEEVSIVPIFRSIVPFLGGMPAIFGNSSTTPRSSQSTIASCLIFQIIHNQKADARVQNDFHLHLKKALYAASPTLIHELSSCLHLIEGDSPY